jgi:hypothetical protein
MEEEQIHNGQKKKDKQRSEKNMHKTNDLYCNNLGPTLYFFFLWNTNMRSIIFSLCYMLFFIQVPVPSQESERSCMYIRCIDFASFYNIDSDFGIVLILFRFYKLTFNYVMLLLTICRIQTCYTGLYLEQNDEYHYWNRNCLPFWLWCYPRFWMGFVIFDL